MKELSIEEKAKAYDIALKKIKMLLGTGSNCSREELEYVFPELKESEDERIMEKVIATIHLYYGEPLEDEAKEMIAWLEKQNSLMKCLQIANARIGELIEENYYLKEKQGEQKSVDDLTQQEAMDIAVAKCFEQGEQKLAENKGMNLAEEDMTPFQKKVFCIIDTTIEEEYGLKQVCDELLRLAHDEITQKPAEWSEIDKAILEDSIYFIKEFRRSNLCDNESRLQNSSTCIEWLASLKDRIFPQPKQEWSEEDEYKYNTILHHLDLRKEKYKKECNQEEQDRYQCLYDWLKSLKERYAWKPSNEQINALAKNVEYVNVGCTQPILKGLLEQLKKLMKE